jgi:predicted transcriptional regulator/transcriptional regulator with XRE-family HTH domain
MARAPVGHRIRKRRQELGKSQQGLASQVGISASYLNLIEHNKRPIGGALLHRIAAAVGLDSRSLAGTEEARLIAELGEVAADAGIIGADLNAADAAELVAHHPRAARAILGLYRAYREARLRSDLLGERLGGDTFLFEVSNQILALITTIRSYSEILKDYGDLSDNERIGFVNTLVAEAETLAARAGDMFDFLSGRGARRPRPAPREEIEDFISDHANHFPRLEEAAERTVTKLPAGQSSLEALRDHLAGTLRIAVRFVPAAEVTPAAERLDGATFLLSDELARSSVRFRLARLIGMQTYGALIGEIVDSAALASPGAGPRLTKALANYFAGAVLMPYRPFRGAADELRFDVVRIGHRFDASFEQVCHRLTTLSRPGAEAVPLHFLRTDIAGNISKRFSASGLRLPRYGGACPRWIVHHAFASPGRVVSQVGRLPDGETFLCIARADVAEPGGRDTAGHHAVMIGCAVEHAHRSSMPTASIWRRRAPSSPSASPAGNARARTASTAHSTGSRCPVGCCRCR